jgi:hypothetical protein
MKDFIEKIEKIGFKREFINVLLHRVYKYGRWRIDITAESCWHLTYKDGNPDPLNRVEVTHEFISFDDNDILKKYFAAELREIMLDQLGIDVIKNYH